MCILTNVIWVKLILSRKLWQHVPSNGVDTLIRQNSVVECFSRIASRFLDRGVSFHALEQYLFMVLGRRFYCLPFPGAKLQQM